MDVQKIKELALANGFSLKEQASGNMDLHSYVYEFANAIEQAVKAQAVPEGFVLVPKEMPKSFDEGLYVYSNSISIVDECSEGIIPMSDINHAEDWKLVIEAQEPSHDKS